MQCCFCKEELSENEIYYETKVYHGESEQRQQVRCGFWHFHIDCWLKIMSKSECFPSSPFLTNEEPPSILDACMVGAENFALHIDCKIIDELIKGPTNENHPG